MRNVLLSLFSALLLLQAGTASAQIITQNGRDSASGNFSFGDPILKVKNQIRSGSSTPVKLEWKVISHNLGTNPGWPLYSSSLGAGVGFCDNIDCYTITDPVNNFFNDSTIVQQTRNYDNNSANINDADHNFYMQFIANSPAAGTSAYVRVRATDMNGSGNRVLTFVASRTPTGISNSVYNDEIVLYPNPAREAVNVIYDANAGVRTIAVYNLIGKLMGPVYKPSASGSAKINTEDMPGGVYFLRLMDGQGHVVATRRFTRQ